jgi:hypothetical protein
MSKVDMQQLLAQSRHNPIRNSNFIFNFKMILRDLRSEIELSDFQNQYPAGHYLPALLRLRSVCRDFFYSAYILERERNFSQGSRDDLKNFARALVNLGRAMIDPVGEKEIFISRRTRSSVNLDLVRTIFHESRRQFIRWGILKRRVEGLRPIIESSSSYPQIAKKLAAKLIAEVQGEGPSGERVLQYAADLFVVASKINWFKKASRERLAAGFFELEQTFGRETALSIAKKLEKEFVRLGMVAPNDVGSWRNRAKSINLAKIRPPGSYDLRV